MKRPAFLQKHAQRLEAFLKDQGGSFYLYDMEALAHHADKLMAQAPKGVRLFYACKANPLSKILKLFAQKGLSFDVASPGELLQLSKHTQACYRTLVTGPAKSRAFLSLCLEQGVRTFVAEGPSQLHCLQQLCLEKKLVVDVLLRVQFSWPSGSNKILGGDQITPFGMSADDWKKVDLREFSTLRIRGLHAFQWGNLTQEQELVEIWRSVFAASTLLAQELNLPLEVLDLGGGLGLDYVNGESPLSFGELMEALASLRQKYSVPECWLELGRYLTGPFGYLCTTVVERKEVRGQEQVILASGLNHQARVALTGTPFPALALQPAEECRSYYLYGPLCTALDFLGTAQLPTQIASGDWVVFALAGAYGFTESMPYFLCHEGAGEAVVTAETIEILRTPQAASEWLR